MLKMFRSLPFLTIRLFSTSRVKQTDYLSSLVARGFIQQIFPLEKQLEAKQLLLQKPQTIYAGFDPTAESLHIGNLLILIGLLHFQQAGHKPIVLIGGATGLVGDPTGRKTERTSLSNEICAQNTNRIQKQIERVFFNHRINFCKEREENLNLLIVNNADWYNSISSIHFIRDIGQLFRMGEMLGRSSVRSRLESNGMSFTEFCYQILQAYDWYHLFKEFDCRFQLGGSDQMGNIHSGHDYISKKQNDQVFGLTIPLITNEQGNKFGKSGGNAVWLDSTKTTPFEFYQFFVRQEDDDVEKLLRLFTFLALDEIEHLMKEHKKTPELRLPQKKLADHITLLAHGQDELRHAQILTSALYENDLREFEKAEPAKLKKLFNGAQYVELESHGCTSILDVALKAKCFLSEQDAKRIISAGGFYINQKRIDKFYESFIYKKYILKNGVSLLRVGKKNYTIVKFF